MSKSNLSKTAARLAGAALAATLFAACGSPVETPANFSGDTYQGAADTSVLDAKLQASFSKTLCQGQTPCYAPVSGFANGSPIAFYIAASFTTADTIKLPAAFGPKQVARAAADSSGGFDIDTFRGSPCTPGPAQDPVRDTFGTDHQYPVLLDLPLAPVTGSKNLTYPIATTYAVPGVTGQCNDLKTAASISTDPTAPGRNGAVQPATSSGYEVWLIGDLSANFFDLTGTIAQMPLGWFKGLLIGAVGGAGNAIPLDSADTTKFKFMEGAIQNLPGSFSAVTDAKAIVLPYAKGDANYSPLVHLHNFTLPGGKKIGDYKGICQPGQTDCPANYIRDLSGAPFNTIFIVTSVQ
jgi:hypothetical protein